jgi:8-oxo-dGTP pyrophosphatase MutT (NUDIX family)
MISLQNEEFCFNYRVGGIAIRPADGFVLMHRIEKDHFWALPGGRCDFDEESHLALAREMREEIGAEVQVGRLLFLMECFYSNTPPRCQELGLYYAMTFPDENIYSYQGDFPGYEPNLPLIYRWVPCPSLTDPDAPVAGFPIFPVRLRAALANPLPDTVQHLIGRENDYPQRLVISL